MTRIEVLVEEKSMEKFLEVFLPRILPPQWIINQNIFIRSFEGKQDLQKSIPMKIRAFSKWHEPIGVVVLQDQDSYDCINLKSKLTDLIAQNGNVSHLIRIVCRELESWYIGDLKAVHLSFPSFKYEKYCNISKFRNPDTLNNAAEELSKILPEFQKVSTAGKIAPFIDIDNNKSESFNQFVSGILKFTS